MNKTSCVIYAPVQTFSGYGARSRDIAKAIIEEKSEEWDIKIIPCRWGNTPMNFIEENPKWEFLEKHFITNLESQPDVMIWVTIPSEAKKIGKFNILFTAGIETTLAPSTWVEGCNEVDLVIGSSNHSINVLKSTKYQKTGKITNQPLGVIEWVGKGEVLFEGVNTEIYNNNKLKTNNLDLSQIKENFCFLTVGHWLNGDVGEDRKNIGLTVKAFYETFKNKNNPPALILKTSSSSSSYMDRDLILNKILEIKKTVNTKKIPNVYLLHGDLTDEEMNELYNHPKVKAMVSLTKGEGFGRPLLEFSLSQKPIIATYWSGHIDFLKPDSSILLPGTLTKIHNSATNNFLTPESKWLSVDLGEVGNSLKNVFEDYKKYKVLGKKQSYHSLNNFSYTKMKEKLVEILDNNIPTTPKEIKLNLPNL